MIVDTGTGDQRGDEVDQGQSDRKLVTSQEVTMRGSYKTTGDGESDRR